MVQDERAVAIFIKVNELLFILCMSSTRSEWWAFNTDTSLFVIEEAWAAGQALRVILIRHGTFLAGSAGKRLIRADGSRGAIGALISATIDTTLNDDSLDSDFGK